jgi:biopolymer transport protein ExbD
MAQIEQKDNGGKKKGKQKKMSIHVDFTPMVDMNMLLICFFMLATSMSKPQRMDIALPTNDKTIQEQDRTEAPDSRAVTVILGANDELYYFTGKPDYEELSNTNLIKTSYDASGLRAFLLNKNKNVVEQIDRLKLQKHNLEISDSVYTAETARIKKESETSPIIIIKPTEESSYKNLVDVLDEMLISNINMYAIVDVDPNDLRLIEYFKTGVAPAYLQETN